jgi:DNA-binding NtrC family response regulator
VRVLHLAYDERDAELVGAVLAHGQLPCEITPVYNRRDYLAALERGGTDVVLADLLLPGFEAMSALQLLRSKQPGIPCIVFSGFVGEEAVVECHKQGVADFLLKNQTTRLVPAIRRALKLPVAGKETVLVVEDEPDLLDLTHTILTQQGYRVLTAGHGLDGLRIARQQSGPIHLVVTDMVMPEMGGKEMAAALRAAIPNLKVLFTSGYLEHAAAYNAAAEKGTDFLPKPYTPADLLSRVRRMLDA